MDTDPEKALEHARHATSLGDLASPLLQSQLLDYGGADHSMHMGKDRVRTISLLIARLDPVFSFNILSSKQIEKLGFIQYLTGKHSFH